MLVHAIKARQPRGGCEAANGSCTTVILFTLCIQQEAEGYAMLMACACVSIGEQNNQKLWLVSVASPGFWSRRGTRTLADLERKWRGQRPPAQKYFFKWMWINKKFHCVTAVCLQLSSIDIRPSTHCLLLHKTWIRLWNHNRVTFYIQNRFKTLRAPLTYVCGSDYKITLHSRGVARARVPHSWRRHWLIWMKISQRKPLETTKTCWTLASDQFLLSRSWIWIKAEDRKSVV